MELGIRARIIFHYRHYLVSKLITSNGLLTFFLGLLSKVFLNFICQLQQPQTFASYTEVHHYCYYSFL